MRSARLGVWRSFLVLALLASAMLPMRTTHARGSQRTAITVLRGEIALVRTDGSAVQPAPSGSEIGPGDQLRVVSLSGASVRLVDGLEMDLTRDTIIAFAGLVKSGSRTNLMVHQIQGSSQTYVAFLADPESSLNMVVGGTVAVVAWGVLAVAGPTEAGKGTVIGISCSICLDSDYLRSVEPGSSSGRSAIVALAAGQPLASSGHSSEDRDTLADAESLMLRAPIGGAEDEVRVNGAIVGPITLGTVPASSMPGTDDANAMRQALQIYYGLSAVDAQRMALGQTLPGTITGAAQSIGQADPGRPQSTQGSNGSSSTGIRPEVLSQLNALLQNIIQFIRDLKQAQVEIMTAITEMPNSAPRTSYMRYQLGGPAHDALNDQGHVTSKQYEIQSFSLYKSSGSDPLTAAVEAWMNGAQELENDQAHKPCKKDEKDKRTLIEESVTSLQRQTTPTTTQLACLRPAPTTVSCVVFVSANVTGGGFPTGTVAFATTSGVSRECTLVRSGPSVSQCSISLTSAAPVTVSAEYRPDSQLFGSSTTTATVVAPPAS